MNLTGEWIGHYTGHFDEVIAITQTGDEVVHEGTRLTVVLTEGRRAARIRVTPPPAASTAA